MSHEEVSSEMGDDIYANPSVQASGAESSQHAVPAQGPRPIERQGQSTAMGWGKGPVSADTRKFKYDVMRGKIGKALPFSASKVDRMEADVAGDMLHSIHVMYGIDKEDERRLVAFDKALFWEHAINGASLMQPGRGKLIVDSVGFDIQPLKDKLGVDQRRFFRAFADDVATVVVEVMDAYDFYDPESVEKVAMIKQIAVARGLQKFPRLIHDSSDAGTDLSYDERVAVMGSKRIVLESTVNVADSNMANRTVGARAPDGGLTTGVGRSL